MKNQLLYRRYTAAIAFSVASLAAASLLVASSAMSQNPQLQERVAEIKQAMSLNKQVLAQYTWQEQQTVSVKGEVKKQELFQVHIGPDGQQQKTNLDPDQDSAGRRHGIKHRIEEDYENYGKQIAALAQSYAQSDPGRLQQLYEQGNVLLGSAGASNEVKVVIQGYQKPGDSVTLVFNKAQQAIQSLQISSYLNDPQDAVTISAQYAQLPNGPNHVATMIVNGISKQLTVNIQNSNYQQAQQTGSTGYSGQGAPLSADELQQLVAPIALYPDALVAQILGAATFPDQVVYASDWLQQNQNLTGQTLMQAVDAQSWDPSVKGLTQFPSVLNNLAKNLSWTSSLGEAYHTQTAEVMSAIQVLRAKAQAAGNLKSGSEITVVQQSPQTIVIQPANPQVVYVPVYNPTVVYGYPYVTPAYTAPPVAATAVVAFGVGVAVGAMMSNSCCSWGYSSWNCGWHGGAVVYQQNNFYGNNAWHGGYYGSSGSAYGPYGTAHYSSGYNPSTGTYARGATASNAYGSQHVGQAYNPNTGAYGATHQASNAYGSYGSSAVSKNGQTAYTQHQTTAQGSVGSVQTSNGGRGVAATGAGGSGYAGETANGNKYAGANGKSYSNTGGGWQKTSGQGGSWGNSDASRGWGSQEKSGGSSAWGEGNSRGSGSSGGWGSRSASSRGWSSRGGGGGWGGGGGRRW